MSQRCALPARAGATAFGLQPKELRPKNSEHSLYSKADYTSPAWAARPRRPSSKAAPTNVSLSGRCAAASCTRCSASANGSPTTDTPCTIANTMPSRRRGATLPAMPGTGRRAVSTARAKLAFATSKASATAWTQYFGTLRDPADAPMVRHYAAATATAKQGASAEPA